jgi:hypothetical protein
MSSSGLNWLPPHEQTKTVPQTPIQLRAPDGTRDARAAVTPAVCARLVPEAVKT